jgi:hypothetical protein
MPEIPEIPDSECENGWNIFMNHWMGLRENWNRKPLYLMVKTMVSCKFSLKPIQ